MVFDRLRADVGMKRAWVGVGSTIAGERPFGDSGGPPPGSRRDPHRPSEGPPGGLGDLGPHSYRLGWPERQDLRRRVIVSRSSPTARRSARSGRERASNAGQPTLEETRLLAATADQEAQVLRRDRLAAAAADAEIERRSDELRSALLDSVSHDLRTPAGDDSRRGRQPGRPAIDLDEAERRATARAIDDEAERMSRLVDSLLDMSRIQSGSLVTDLEVTPSTELLDPILERYRPRVTGRLIGHDPRRPAGRPRRPDLPEPGTVQRPRQRGHPLRAWADLALSARSTGDAVEIRIEDSGAGGPDRCAAATVRSLLSRARRRHGFPPRRGAGVDRGPWPGRGDRWDGPSIRKRAGRARDHHPRPRRANPTARQADGGAGWSRGPARRG